MPKIDMFFMDYLMQKVISPEEAYMKASDKNAFEKFLTMGPALQQRPGAQRPGLPQRQGISCPHRVPAGVLS